MQISFLDKKIYSNDILLLNTYINSYPTLSKKRIWLFIDRINRADDNAEFLFRYCNKINNGIDNYFIIKKDASDYSRLKQYGNVVEFGSMEHKILHLFAEKLISSDFAFSFKYPFGSREQIDIFQGLCKFKFIFLQHGIIKDDMSNILNKWEVKCDLFLTSTKIEYDSLLSENYGYGPTVIKLTGLPRFDYQENKTEKYIVFMPTWRKALIKGNAPNYEYNEAFKNSLFCKSINEFLTSGKLINVLSAYGYTLLYRPHVNLYIQEVDFQINNDKVMLLPNDYSYRTLYSEASLMITDYSSAIFDFAYLKKPIIYYQFDERPLGDGYFDYNTMGFGEVVNNFIDVINLLIKQFEKGCVMSDKYKKRVDKFFYYNDCGNCNRVYDEIINMGLQKQ